MASKYVVLVQSANSVLGSEGLVIGDITEGGHTITNEVVDRVRGGKTGRGYGANAEEFTFTANKIEDDEGQEEVDGAIRAKEQLKVWLVPRRVSQVQIGDAVETVAGHDDVIFGYTVVSEIGHSFDDEEDTVEYTLAVHFETAKGTLPKLPDSVLNPSTVADVDFETPGEYTGSYEERTQA